MIILRRPRCSYSQSGKALCLEHPCFCIFLTCLLADHPEEYSIIHCTDYCFISPPVSLNSLEVTVTLHPAYQRSRLAHHQQYREQPRYAPGRHSPFSKIAPVQLPLIVVSFVGLLKQHLHYCHASGLPYRYLNC